VHQVGDQTKVILRCTVNQPPRIAFMCFVWLSEQTVTFVLRTDRLVFIPVLESVYSGVCTKSLYNTYSLVLKGFHSMPSPVVERIL